jgi:uncharacterized protein YgiM (DUF1202 family)
MPLCGAAGQEIRNNNQRDKKLKILVVILFSWALLFFHSCMPGGDQRQMLALSRAENDVIRDYTPSFSTAGLFLSTTKTVSDTLTFEDKEDTVYTIAETTVNLRSDASLSSTILASLTYGTKLERTGLATAPDADGVLWSRVTLGDKVGYVSTAFLSETPVVTFTDADETLYVNASSLNVRALPAYESSVLTSLPMGTEVKCLGKATAADADGITWFKIQAGETVGYASGRYLAAEMPE